MLRKSVMVFIIFFLISSVSLSIAEAPHFPKVLKSLRSHGDRVWVETREIEQLTNRLHQLAVEIEDLSNTIDFPGQKEKSVTCGGRPSGSRRG